MSFCTHTAARVYPRIRSAPSPAPAAQPLLGSAMSPVTALQKGQKRNRSEAPKMQEKSITEKQCPWRPHTAVAAAQVSSRKGLVRQHSPWLLLAWPGLAAAVAAAPANSAGGVWPFAQQAAVPGEGQGEDCAAHDTGTSSNSMSDRLLSFCGSRGCRRPGGGGGAVQHPAAPARRSRTASRARRDRPPTAAGSFMAQRCQQGLPPRRAAAGTPVQLATASSQERQGFAARRTLASKPSLSLFSTLPAPSTTSRMDPRYMSTLALWRVRYVPGLTSSAASRPGGRRSGGEMWVPQRARARPAAAARADGPAHSRGCCRQD